MIDRNIEQELGSARFNQMQEDSAKVGMFLLGILCVLATVGVLVEIYF